MRLKSLILSMLILLGAGVARADWIPPTAIDVSKRGAKADGATDNAAALQAVVDSIPAGRPFPANPAGGVVFYFPAGRYAVSKSLDLSRLNSFAIHGDTDAAGLPASQIVCTTPNTPAVKLTDGGRFQIRNMGFSGSPMGGAGFSCAGTIITPSLENCDFSGGACGFQNWGQFTGAVRRSRFRGPGMGLLARLPTACLVADSSFDGCTEGVRASGAGLSVARSSFTNNQTAARLAADDKGVNWGYNRSAWRDVRLTGNGKGIVFQIPGQLNILSNAGAADTPATVIKSANVDNVLSYWPDAASIVDVTTRGLKGDRTTDNAAAFQSLVNGSSPGTTFYFPAGIYPFSTTIDFSALASWAIIGDCSASGGSRNGSTLVASAGLPLIKTGGTFRVLDVNIMAGAAAILATNSTGSIVQDCYISGGIRFDNATDCCIRTTQFSGAAVASLIINGGSGCTVEGGDFMSSPEAIRICGTGHAIFASRFEVHGIGLNLGMNADGAPTLLTGASIQGLSMEANTRHIVCNKISNCILGGIGTQGSPNAPGGHSLIGLTVLDASNCDFAAIGMGGAYFTAAIRIVGPVANCRATQLKAWSGSPNNSGLTLDIYNENFNGAFPGSN
jgi:hypothetical protein